MKFGKQPQEQPRPKIKVRIKQSIAGHADKTYDLPDFGFAPGEVVALDSRLAESWISSGIAEAVNP
jgi:hypothetical protein